MGSTSSPPKPRSPLNRPSSEPTTDQIPTTIELDNVQELRRLLELRDQEVLMLKFELEKYKLALQQSQLDFHYLQQQRFSRTEQAEKNDNLADDNLDTLLLEAKARTDALLTETGIRPAGQGHVPSDDIEVVDNSTNQSVRLMRCRQSSSPALSNSSPGRNRVVFRTGDDEEDDDDINNTIEVVNEDPEQQLVPSDNLDDMVQDVSEIDLNLDAHKKGDKGIREAVKRDKTGTLDDEHGDDDDGTEEDEDIISDGLLTSLTDAAISNLSQLAALQERCESQQQQHSPHQYQQSNDYHHHHQQQQHNQQHQQRQQKQASSPVLPLSVRPTSATTPIVSSPSLSLVRMNQSNEYGHDRFSTSTIASQAAIAISAAAAGRAQTPPGSSSIGLHKQQALSSSGSISPNSTIQADLSSSNSLASVVAAAAVAAAAANSDQQQQQQHLQHHTQLSPQSRLISSAIQSPDFYHTLHHGQLQNSPVSSLHFSPSTSTTPSPSSLLAQSRRSASNATSSSLMSPIASPNYLRRQFMSDRLHLMSPSATSGIATGSSSGTSSSLAQILHHQNQKRSASALGTVHMASTSSTPLSSGGSTAVSPLMSNKNSSQARLNNMQIRHKFGYLGSGRAQFNSPHGFCLGLNQEIVVADTNNHRVCIFDKSGTYITQFGSPGKEEGQLWNPRKVAILHRPVAGTSSSASSSSALQSSPLSSHPLSKNYQNHQHNQSSAYSNSTYSSPDIGLQTTGSVNQSMSGSEPLYVVCDRGAERSRMQLFTKDGAFIKKIGIHYIDIVAGLAITQNGLIIVVDSVSPTVYIINGETGILNGWFDCSGYMKEPSDIAVKSDVPGNEYFICDFKGHCVVVFSEQGEYLRKIGHDGLTSYPNGIDISDDGDILVGDSHGNRFHVVVFDRNGKCSARSLMNHQMCLKPLFISPLTI